MFTSNLRMDRKNYLKDRIKNGLLYTCYGIYADVAVKKLIQSSRSPFLSVICIPGGLFLLLHWRKK